jgi:hypothetical protein
VAYLTPTSSDFKAQFPRDFPYAVTGFGAVMAITLGAGGAIASVAVAEGGRGYKPGAQLTLTDPTGTGAVLTATITNGTLVSVSVTTPGSGYTAPAAALSGGDNTKLEMVTDDDINGAIQDANFNVNQALFDDQPSFTRAFLFLAAHQLCENIQAAIQGVGSQYAWLTQAKSVDGVSQSFMIPERVSSDPFLSALSTTRYGINYLKIVLPFIVGHAFSTMRETNPV